MRKKESYLGWWYSMDLESTPVQVTNVFLQIAEKVLLGENGKSAYVYVRLEGLAIHDVTTIFPTKDALLLRRVG